MNGEEVFRQENRHGTIKDYLQVDIGTSVVEVPRYIRNPLTDRRHDLTKLSEDGYLKPFLALQHASNSSDVIDLGSTPVLTFDKDRWELRDNEGQHVLAKRDPESRYGEVVLNREADRDD